jgi:FkbM family methyltransferase
MEQNISIYFKQTDFGNFCLLQNDLISNFINDYGCWEGHLYNLYREIINEDDIVLDGGANIGFHTVQFASIANKGKVYAFEPQALIYNILSTNILFNGASHIIHQYKLGLSDKESTETLTPMDNSGIYWSDTCINWGGRGFTEGGTEEAQTIALDSFNLDKLDFIKLDIQGFEYKALMGGINTIKKNMPTIFIENYDGRCAEHLVEQERAPIDLLLSLGYNGYRLNIGNCDDCIFTTDEKIVEIIKKYDYNFEIIK